MSNVINVFQNEDPYLTQTVVQLVTRAGTFMDKSQARVLIASGDVVVDGTPVKKPHAVLSPGPHHIRVGTNTYNVKVIPSAIE